MNNIFFLGTDFFASNILKCLFDNNIKISLVISKSDSNIGRGRLKKQHPVALMAEYLKLPLYKVNSLNNKESEKFINSSSPDLIILVGYGEKISEKIIKIPKFGIWNVHPSSLPNYKGSMPIQYSILNGDLKTGVSVISINNIIDSGDILNFQECIISHDDNFLSLSNKLVKIGTDCLINLLYNFDNIFFKKLTRSIEISSYSYRFDKEFYNINWKDSALNIDRKIRAFFGIKKFSSKINSKEFKIIETKVKICDKIYHPGRVLNIDFKGMDVSTGFGIICIEKIQFPGKNIIFIKDLINSGKVFFKIGDNLE